MGYILTQKRGNNVNIPCNHFYLWESMFEVSQNFPGLWVRNFVGSVAGINLINFKQLLVYMFMGM